jgi:N6-adenosine-specific RNA methylase IME4
MIKNEINTSLASISAAKNALVAASNLEDVLTIRDKAKAIQELVKARNASLETQNAAAEIRLRAERKAGEMLHKMNLKRGKKAIDTTMVSIKDLGITGNQSSRWQLTSKVKERDFVKIVTECNAIREELTQKRLLDFAKKMTKAEKLESEIIEQPESEDGSVVDDLTNLEQRKFGTIYADPPWQYGNQGTRASTGNHYNTMTLDDICSMPVESLAADDAHLHLWTTNAFLFDAKRVMDAWGFEYRSVFVWVKPQMGIGNYWRVSHEFLLLGIRGNAKRFNEHNHMSWAQIDRSKHSAKPEQIRRTIEKVSNGPYLELFGRNQVHGWTVFGNQVSAQSVLAI